MKISYVPAPCKGDSAEFEGQVVLNAPAYEDLLEVIAGNPEILELQDDENIASPAKMKMMLSLVKWSYGFYEKVDITRKSDKKRYQSLDDLRFDMKAAPILQDIATKLSSGLDLGNS